MMLQSNSFKSYSYSIAYLALSVILGYMSIKNLSSDSYLFECVILFIAIIAFIKSLIIMKNIKKNIGAYILLALNVIIFSGFTIWQNPSLESMGTQVFILLIIVLVADFITYQIGIRLNVIE